MMCKRNKIMWKCFEYCINYVTDLDTMYECIEHFDSRNVTFYSINKINELAQKYLMEARSIANYTSELNADALSQQQGNFYWNYSFSSISISVRNLVFIRNLKKKVCINFLKVVWIFLSRCFLFLISINFEYNFYWIYFSRKQKFIDGTYFLFLFRFYSSCFCRCFWWFPLFFLRETEEIQKGEFLPKTHLPFTHSVLLFNVMEFQLPPVSLRL